MLPFSRAAVGRVADPVTAASKALSRDGVIVVPAESVLTRLGVSSAQWRNFCKQWDDLEPDDYAAAFGGRRTRRFGHFLYRPSTREKVPVAHHAFVQPEQSNPLYIGTDRHFAPLTDEFATSPVLSRLLDLLGEVAVTLDDIEQWHVKVTPFRVWASADGDGQPTPEGRHRDGVTLVSTLLVGRRNVAGGASSVFDLDGHELLTTALTEPGTLLLGDDRRTLHEVSAVRAEDHGAPAHRDVLVVTFAGSDS